MIRTVLLVAALLAVSEGAVLVRFINTVPSRLAASSVLAPPASSATGPLSPLTSPATSTGPNPLVDRVGLQYFSQTSGTITSPTLVWTQILGTNDIVGGSNAFAAPYAYILAMPPLRAYHTLLVSSPATAETVAVDKPFSVYHTTDNWSGLPVDFVDNYDHSRLLADGVGLYMSFAAGTYRMQAYAAITDTSTTSVTTPSNAFATIQAAIPRAFSGSGVSFTFVDGHVYTIISYGAAQFGATVPLTGNTVMLTMIEESIAPTTFGKASVRWFNAFAAQSNAMDVYLGAGVASNALLASGIAVGTVSSYVDVAPSTTAQFPVAVSGSTANYLASSTNVQHDIRAGSRSTIICGISDEATSIGYCRAIPSRAVAYVRLVSDVAGQDALVQGQVGAQKLSQTLLNVWASYEYPRPEAITEQSQVMGSPIYTGHPATTDGLYPVVINVAPGTVSGYGEVFVPLYIMDFALRYVITPSPATYTTSGNLVWSAATSATLTSYLFSPKLKRVNFLIKTDGFATLTGRIATDDGGAANTDDFIFPFVSNNQQGKQPNPGSATLPFTGGTGTPALTTDTYNLQLGITLDKYLEAGEYYTIFATAANAAVTTTPSSLELGNSVGFFIRRDRTVDTISSGTTSGKGILSIVPFGGQSLTTGTFSLQQTATSTVPTVPNLATVGVDTSVDVTVMPAVAWKSTTSAEISLAVGAYTFSYSAGATTTACNQKIPASGNINIVDSQMTDLFVLNVYGCLNNNNDASRLSLVVVQRQSAAASGNSPFPTTSSRSAVDEATQRHAVPLA